MTGVLFLLFFPLFYLWFRPHNDIQYHLSPREPQELNGNTIRKSLRNNIYARLHGKILPNSIVARNVGNILLPKYTFIFRLKGYPENFVLYIKKGRLHEELNKHYKTIADRKDKRGLLHTFIRKKIMGIHAFEGRIYSSWHILFPFENYYYEDDVGIGDYFNDLMGEGSGNSDNLYFMAVGETPSLNNLADTHAPVFLVGIMLGIAGLFFFMSRKSQDKAAFHFFEKANDHLSRGNFEKALPLLKKAYSCNPDDEKIKKAYASVLSVTGAPEEALKLYDSLLGKNPDNTGLLGDKANTLEILGQTEEAFRVYDRIRELSPHDPTPYFNKGTSLERIQRYEEALRFYDSIIEDQPDYSSAYYNKACLLNARMDRKIEARETLLKAIELEPSYAEDIEIDDDLKGLLDKDDLIL